MKKHFQTLLDMPFLQLPLIFFKTSIAASLTRYEFKLFNSVKCNAQYLNIKPFSVNTNNLTSTTKLPLFTLTNPQQLQVDIPFCTSQNLKYKALHFSTIYIICTYRTAYYVYQEYLFFSILTSKMTRAQRHIFMFTYSMNHVKCK